MKPKLVRDLIPNHLTKIGKKFTTEILPSDRLESALWEKLEEELSELKKAKNKEEIADVIEVVLGLGAVFGHSEEEILSKLYEKRAERGGFRLGVVLTSLDEA